MNRSESVVELATALAKAQGAMPAVPKNGRGQVGTQRTSYVTFDDLVATVKVPLAENGLSFLQMLDDGGLTTMLLHSSGQWIAASMPVTAMEANRGTNAMQALGSTLTYLKRYALAAMLGVASDEDDDASASDHKPQPRPQPKPAAAQSQDAPDEPPDAWDEEAQDEAPETGEPFIDIAEVGVFTSKNGKPHLGLMEAGHKWPDIRWWAGRDALLECAPWLAQAVTKEQLAVMDARYPFRARVYYTVDDQNFKQARRFELI